MAKVTKRGTIPWLNSAILFLIYVAAALTLVRYRVEIAAATGIPMNVIVGAAIAAFLAITFASMYLRRKKN
jgi:hypothetical protein